MADVRRVPERVWSNLRWYTDRMWQQFWQHDCLSAAGALTYTTLFAVVPLMTVIYTAFSLMPEYAHVGQQVQNFIFENFVPGSSDVVQQKLNEFADRARGLTGFGFAILFVTSFVMLLTIERRFNLIWQVAEPRRGLQRFLVYWGVLSLGPACVLGGVISTGYVLSLPLVSDLEVLGPREELISYLPAVLSLAGFTILYYAVPNCHVPFKYALIGGAVTTLVFQWAISIFADLSTRFTYDAVYGTFAAVPVFLMWLYLVWVIVLGGAIFVRSLSLSHKGDENTEPVLIKAARILRLLYDAHLDGKSITDKKINRAVPLNQAERDRIFGVFQDLNILTLTENEHWTLGRSLKSLSLWDMYRQFPEGLEMERLQQVTDMPNVVNPLMAITQFGSNEMSVSMDTVFST